MRLDCARCGRPVDAADINVQTSIAKCGQCGEVFGFAELVPGGRAGGGVVKHAVELPKGMTVERDAVSTTIVRRWFTPALFFLLFFCAAWDGFLIFWYSVAIGGGAGGGMPAGPRLLFVVFPLGHVAVGVGLTYYLLCGFLNKTRIRVTQQEVSVAHGPLPWPGARTIPRAEIEQLFCEREAVRNKAGSTGGFRVSAELCDGRRVVLVAGIEAADKARFIEQEVEKTLGIRDRPVHGELDS